jgi:hypothetical protein
MILEVIRGCGVGYGGGMRDHPERSWLDAIAGTAAWQDSMAKIAGTAGMQDSVARIVGTAAFHRSVVDIAGTAAVQDSVARIVGKSALQKSLVADIAGTAAVQDSVARIVGKSLQKSVTGIVGKSSFAETIGANKTVSEIVSQPGFASMVGTAALPRSDWMEVLEGLRGQIGPELYEDGVAGFDTVADVAGEGDGEGWWIERLPMYVQLGLLLFVLQALDQASEFMADLTGDDLPPAYRSGTQLVFALALALLAFIEQKMKAVPEEEKMGGA